MTIIKEIHKKDIPLLLEDAGFWKTPFLAVSRHRLLAHYNNPTADADDVVLLLAYIDDELVGYMGVFIDKIMLDGIENKIGWLSTWWVHPKTKGSGIGRDILNKMYDVNSGRIGISQFTPSAKRVYDKSGYFYTLKENEGLKAVLKSNFTFLLPQLYPSLMSLKPLFRLADFLINIPVRLKLQFGKGAIRKRLSGITIEYLNTIDTETAAIISKYNTGHISKKSKSFFEWLKACNWVQEAPLLEFTNKNKYEFSIYDNSFAVYLLKVIKNGNCIGFTVLQKRNKVIKVLFSYHDQADAGIISDIIKLQSITQDITEIVCYDKEICDNFKKSGVFIYRRKKIKQSIISKVFGKDNFDDTIMNFGDGDCSFA